VEDGVGRIFRDLEQELSNSVGLGWKPEVLGEGGVEVDGVECFETGGVLDEGRRPCDGVDKPWLAPDIPGVKNSLALTLQHCRPRSQYLAQLRVARAGSSRNMTAPGQWLASNRVT